jgi:hypothetical protein
MDQPLSRLEVPRARIEACLPDREVSTRRLPRPNAASEMIDQRIRELDDRRLGAQTDDLSL